MHQNKNNIDANGTAHLNADARRSKDPYLTDVLKATKGESEPHYSEALNAVMDEMSGVSTCRRADLINSQR